MANNARKLPFDSYHVTSENYYLFVPGKVSFLILLLEFDFYFFN